MNTKPSKVNASLMAIMGLMIVGMFGLVESGILDTHLAEAVSQNTDDIREHEKLISHPVTANELQHINEKLQRLELDSQFTKEHVIKIYQLLCSTNKDC